MSFDLPQFLPYLLNQAAEAASNNFRIYYGKKYGMLRTEWRVLFHLGCYGAMSAKEICDKGALHKTKVSRAVSALETKQYLVRCADDADRRVEHLTLTETGQKVFADLERAAEEYEVRLRENFSKAEFEKLRKSLQKLASRGLLR